MTIGVVLIQIIFTLELQKIIGTTHCVDILDMGGYMRDFPWSGYSKWQDPPNLHEICGCEDCHEDGEHADDVKHWANVEGCWACVDTVRKAVDNNEYCLFHHAWYCELIHEGAKLHP